MSFVKFFALPLGIIALAAVYWFLSYEAAGTAMLLIFGIAMGLMSWVLVPTVNNAGPTAPIDEDWHERR